MVVADVDEEADGAGVMEEMAEGVLDEGGAGVMEELVQEDNHIVAGLVAEDYRKTADSCNQAYGPGKGRG
ncbi:hypothetical protein MLD38_008372 [Melastoma candidum]|uniref:Uncharacterized protein n=1 Tax=Melastoma candidum TaxID=119954 RepID=A0ACB9RUN0_9MYRT|nr:hypothetical protein MLD38_008372 [Melastoma candidum]